MLKVILINTNYNFLTLSGDGRIRRFFRRI